MRYRIVIGPKGRIVAAAPVPLKPERGAVTFAGFGGESKAAIREVEIAEPGEDAATLYKRLREAASKRPSKARRSGGR